MVFAQCRFLGSDKLILEVKTCSVNSNIPTLGVVIKGNVIESAFVLASHVNNSTEDYALKINKGYDFFMPNGTLELCSNITNKTIKVESIFKCCDTLPAKGLCLVPSKYIKIKRWQ